MADTSSSFLVINDVIMISLLLLKIIYVLDNFLDLFRDHTYLRELSVILYNYFEGNLNSANKFNNMTSE